MKTKTIEEHLEESIEIVMKVTGTNKSGVFSNYQPLTVGVLQALVYSENIVAANELIEPMKPIMDKLSKEIEGDDIVKNPLKRISVKLKKYDEDKHIIIEEYINEILSGNNTGHIVSSVIGNDVMYFDILNNKFEATVEDIKTQLKDNKLLDLVDINYV